jgi:hypothetical protein
MSGFTSLGKKSSGGGGFGSNSNSTGPFGTALVSNLTPAAQAAFIYGSQVNSLLWITSSNGTGAAVTSVEGVMSCSSGASTYGSATIRTNRFIKYRAGQGVVCRLTAIFDAGKTDTRQLAGVGNKESGYYFARVGENFGILHQERSKREIRYFTLTGQNSVTVTVTLAGSSKSFSIAGGTNANQTAYLVSRQDYSQVESGWTAESNGSTVYFIADNPGPKGGEFSVKVAGASIASASGTTQSGQLPVSTFISQSQWNLDTMDGNGSSRVNLDASKGNIYGIGYQYLGFGDPVFSIENPETGLLSDVHRIQTANARNATVLRNPQMAARWVAINSGSAASSVTIKGASACIFNEGLVTRNIGVSFASSATKTSISTTVVPVITLRADSVIQGQCGYGALDPFNISLGCDSGNSATNKILKILVYKNVDLGGPANFQKVDDKRSIASYDTSATTISVNENSQLIKSVIVAANSSVTLKIDDENFYVGCGDTITIAAVRAGSSDVDGVIVSLSWFEDQ